MESHNHSTKARKKVRNNILILVLPIASSIRVEVAVVLVAVVFRVLAHNGVGRRAGSEVVRRSSVASTALWRVDDQIDGS
jgi:hypothetical protein